MFYHPKPVRYAHVSVIKSGGGGVVRIFNMCFRELHYNEYGSCVFSIRR